MDKVERQTLMPSEELPPCTSNFLLGFDIGGTKCAVVIGRKRSEGIKITDRIVFATETLRGPQFALRELEDSTRKLLLKHGLSLTNVAALGISCGGPLDAHSGVILSPPNLPGWDRVPVKKHFEAALQIPVFLQNDADACALAEWKWGAGRGCRNMIFLSFGTGMGAGLILDGRLYTGANNHAGEVGHVRLENDGPWGHGKYGSVEGFCSGGGIARLAQQEIRRIWKTNGEVSFCHDEEALSRLTARDVAEAARAGDPMGVGIFKIVAGYLGRSLAMLIDILNPEMIIIGGIFMRNYGLFHDTVERVIADEALISNARMCRVVPAALGEEIGDFACLSVAVSIQN